MCKMCNPSIAESRRHFLKGLSAATLGLSSLASLSAFATPPKPENLISPQQALERLMQGNDRYLTNNSTHIDFNQTREALTRGQNPYACILSCSDSRVAPEMCFDSERGDLFVTRVAGNYVAPSVLASLEYGTAVLKSPLIMVLGHTSCGAIGAAIKAVKDDQAFPGHIQSIASDLGPAVRAALDASPKDLDAEATRQNVMLNVLKLKQATPVLSRLTKSSSLLIVGGVYDLETGRVERIV